jgi:hypothetical protein
VVVGGLKEDEGRWQRELEKRRKKRTEMIFGFFDGELSAKPTLYAVLLPV